MLIACGAFLQYILKYFSLVLQFACSGGLIGSTNGIIEKLVIVPVLMELATLVGHTVYYTVLSGGW